MERTLTRQVMMVTKGKKAGGATVNSGTSGPRPLGLLSEYGKLYPRAAKMAAEAHEGWSRSRGFKDWSYIPHYDVVKEIVLAQVRVGDENGRTLGDDYDVDLSALEAIVRWRLTKGVYAFDPEIFVEVASMPLDGDLPIEILFRLPERCVYVEIPPGLRLGGEYEGLRGFFAYLCWDALLKVTELVLALDYEDGLRAFCIDLVAPTLEGCIAKWGEILRQTPGFLEEFERRFGKGSLGDLSDPRVIAESNRREAGYLRPFVSLVLYLCAANAEIASADGSDRRPANPEPRRTKRSPRKVFAAERPTTWNVAWRVGAELRREHRRRGGTDGEGVVGRGVRPHIRRAHWHTYWTGPRDPARADERAPVLRWVRPIAVGVGPGGEDGIPAVIRPMRPAAG